VLTVSMTFHAPAATIFEECSANVCKCQAVTSTATTPM
jgi:hypothetical protein